MSKFCWDKVCLFVLFLCTIVFYSVFVLWSESSSVQKSNLLNVKIHCQRLYFAHKDATVFCFPVSPHATRLRGCIITLVAFVLLLSSVSSHMSTQRTWIRACKIALVAFVRLFSTVRFQMCPQMACLRGCIVALVAFVRLFSTVRFQMLAQMACPRRGIVSSHTGYICLT